jgi:hypothetical protein
MSIHKLLATVPEGVFPIFERRQGRVLEIRERIQSVCRKEIYLKSAIPKDK